LAIAELSLLDCSTGSDARFKHGSEGRSVGSIDTIEGIGRQNARALRKSGVRTTEKLLRVAGNRSGRKDLAGRTGLAEKQILDWVNRSDLMRVKGVGEEYSDLLEAAGVDTCKELRNRNPQSLLQKMTQVNAKNRLVRRLPTEVMVERWVAHAKQLPPVVTR
jgi:predicted flap endonuclease-1-like 5' DNA nuclease